MPRPAPKTSSANRRVCSAALTVTAAWLVLPLPAQATRLVPVYTVDVAERGGSALQDAMRQALVRATGRREAAEDPALAALVADASTYVKDWDTGARGQAQVVFDGGALERAVTAAGRTLGIRNGRSRSSCSSRRVRVRPPMRRARSWNGSPPSAACRSA